MRDCTVTLHLPGSIRFRDADGSDTTIEAIDIDVIGDAVYSLNATFAATFDTTDPREQRNAGDALDIVLQTLGIDVAFDVAEGDDNDGGAFERNGLTCASIAFDVVGDESTRMVALLEAMRFKGMAHAD